MASIWWPDITNTGPRGINAKPAPLVGSFADYTPPNPLVANTVADGKNFTGGITAVNAGATGCKFTRCQSIGQGYDIEDNNNVVFEDCEFDGLGADVVVGFTGYTMRRCYVHNGGDALHANGDCLFEDCFLTCIYKGSLLGHEQTMYGAGAANVTPPGESAVITFRHCTLWGDVGPGGLQAVISLICDQGTISSCIIDNCYLKFTGSGGGQSLLSFFAKTFSLPSITMRNCVIDPGNQTPTVWIAADTYTVTSWFNNKFISGPNAGKTLNSDGSVT